MVGQERKEIGYTEADVASLQQTLATLKQTLDALRQTLTLLEPAALVASSGAQLESGPDAAADEVWATGTAATEKLAARVTPTATFRVPQEPPRRPGPVSPTPRPTQDETAEEAPDCWSVGTARMTRDGTLIINLTYERPNPSVPGAMFTIHGRYVYGPGHPRYAEMLAYVGAIEPGWFVPVPSSYW